MCTAGFESPSVNIDSPLNSASYAKRIYRSFVLVSLHGLSSFDSFTTYSMTACLATLARLLTLAACSTEGQQEDE